MSIDEYIEQLTDEELKVVANQVLALNDTGIMNEQPLRNMIDEYEGGPVQGIIVVPHLVMLECTKRWCDSTLICRKEQINETYYDL